MTDDLERRLRRIDFEGDTEAARKLRVETHRTLDNQVRSLDGIDSKAIKVLRVNVLLVGLILTALSFAANSRSVSVESFLNVYLGTGLLSLLLSSATVAVTYTGSDVNVGVDPDDIANVLELDLSNEEFEAVVAKSYAMWIGFNDSTNVRNTPWITVTILLIVVAIAYLSLGVHVAFNEGVPWVVEAGANVLLLVLAWRTGIRGQVSKALDDWRDSGSSTSWIAQWAERLLGKDSKN